MRRYHEEKHIIARRSKKYRQINAGWLPRSDVDGKSHIIDDGQFRKSMRCGGCTRARCQVCHPEKYPKRIPTRKEAQAHYDDRTSRYE